MFVAIAEIDRPVIVVMSLEIERIIRALKIPACPTTNPARINMITPSMVRIEGVKTPPKVDSFGVSPTWLSGGSLTFFFDCLNCLLRVLSFNIGIKYRFFSGIMGSKSYQITPEAQFIYHNREKNVEKENNFRLFLFDSTAKLILNADKNNIIIT